MKKILIIVGAILLAALIAAGSFWGGMTYQTNQADQARARFMAARGTTEGEMPQPGGFPGGNLPEGMQPPSSGGIGFPGGATTGIVKTIDGNVMTISTAQDVTTVNLSENTRIEKSASATIADLQPGIRVTVTGQQDDDGNITARQILITNNDPLDPNADPNEPPPTGMEP
jgi:hypothetical protein